MAQPVRGTQTLVDQMGWVFHRPSLVAIEVAWRWLFGVPLTVYVLVAGRADSCGLPAGVAGLANLDAQNPWVAVVQLADVWAHYQPPVVAVLRWLGPLAALAWVVVSGIGRNLVLKRMEPGVRFRPLAMMAVQTSWLALLALTFSGWLRSMQWVAATHITASGEADLIGYSIWAIFLSLGFFTLWALVSWPLAVDADADAAGAALRGLSFRRKLAAGKNVHQQADGNQPGDGHREAGVDRAGDGVFGGAAALQRSARAGCNACCVGRRNAFLPRRERLFSRGEAQGLR